MSTQTETAPGTIVHDAELRAISRVCKELNGLKGEARTRVIAYVLGRYAPEIGCRVVADREKE